MATSTALTYRQYQTVDHSGTGAGKQWLHQLWHLYRFFFVDSEAVDSGRWRLVDSSPSASSWSTLTNVVDNSWFVVEAQAGRQKWQAKFQASNVAALDESPGVSYGLMVSLSPGGGWTAKGAANGGFAAAAVNSIPNKLLGGTNVSANPDGVITIHGDRDTVLVASTTSDTTDYDCGCYIGRFDADSDRIPYPTCLLTAWSGAGVPKGFDRDTAGGVFSATPAGSGVLNHNTVFPAVEAVKCWTSGWLSAGTIEPSAFSAQYHYRPIEITSVSALLGTLRLVWAVGNIGSKSRIDARQKLVLHGGHVLYGVAITHNGTIPP